LSAKLSDSAPLSSSREFLHMKLSFPSVEMRSVQRADEEVLWLVHEANVADLWETVEVPKFDKDGNPVLDKDGYAAMEKIQRPRLMSELPQDLQRVVESVSIDGHARMVPKVYSKLQANAELRILKIDG
jgi:hypothetical protein